jgi:hypothetical protein
VRVYALRPAAIADLPAAGPGARLISHPTVAPRLSILVLPFANLSNDPEQQYFADGITDDLTTDLSRIAGMFVISRNSAFTYRNKIIDTRQIGRELGGPCRPAGRLSRPRWAAAPGPSTRNGLDRTRRWRRQSRANPSLKPKFPASWENTGNFVRLGLRGRLLARNAGLNTIAYDPIPYASEQGI